MKSKITVTTTMEIVLPSLPNFLRTPNKDVTIPIAQLSDAQLDEIGKEWLHKLKIKAHGKRKEGTRAANKRMSHLGR